MNENNLVATAKHGGGAVMLRDLSFFLGTSMAPWTLISRSLLKTA